MDIILCIYQWHPPLPHSRVGWGNSGDLTEYHVKYPTPGALPDVYLSPRIDRRFDIIRLYYANSSCQFHLLLGGNSCQFPVDSLVSHGGGVVGGGVIDRCIFMMTLSSIDHMVAH